NVQAGNAGSYSVWLTNAALLAPGLQSPVAQLTILADTDGDHMPDVWETQYGLNPNSPADANQDKDGDGMTNLQEYLAGTNPNDPQSFLRITAIAADPPAASMVHLQFLAVSNRTYSVLFNDTLVPGLWDKLTDVPAVSTNRLLEITDQPSPLTTQRFYRLVTPQSDDF